MTGELVRFLNYQVDLTSAPFTRFIHPQNKIISLTVLKSSIEKIAEQNRISQLEKDSLLRKIESTTRIYLDQVNN